MVYKCSPNNSDGESDNCEIDCTQERFDSIVSHLLAKLSLSEKNVMTIKNKPKKERSKPDRIEENAERAHSSNTRHPTYSCTVENETQNMYYHKSNIKNKNFNRNLRDDTHCNRQCDHFVYADETQIPVKKSRCLRGSSNAGEAVSPSFVEKREGSGNNSEDEYFLATGSTRQTKNKVEVHEMIRLLKEKMGWDLVSVGTDGACLFRSVAHQIFGDEGRHQLIREQVINYMKENREHFSQFISEDFDRYILRKKDPHEHGNHIEIQAISEIYNRPVEIYHDSIEPINVFHSEYKGTTPIRLSYHGGVHYNSIIDPCNPSFGQGLGMPNYQPGLSEEALVQRALLESEKSLLEESMLKDKLAQSEELSIDRALEEQAVQESYYEYLSQCSTSTMPVPQCESTTSKDILPCSSRFMQAPVDGFIMVEGSKRKIGHTDSRMAPTSVVHSSMPPATRHASLLSSRTALSGANAQGNRPSCDLAYSLEAPTKHTDYRLKHCAALPKTAVEENVGRGSFGAFPITTSGAATVAGSSYDALQHSADSAVLRHIPPEMLDMDETTMLALVMEQSRREYYANESGTLPESRPSITLKPSVPPCNDRCEVNRSSPTSNDSNSFATHGMTLHPFVTHSQQLSHLPQHAIVPSEKKASGEDEDKA